ncbi:hypothetical protein HK101_009303 [Irineochytrium annulatum]|nr:hypothetical protein HK101_009303 [Irineochytrium annulatum]
MQSTSAGTTAGASSRLSSIIRRAHPLFTQLTHPDLFQNLPDPHPRKLNAASLAIVNAIVSDHFPSTPAVDPPPDPFVDPVATMLPEDREVEFFCRVRGGGALIKVRHVVGAGLADRLLFRRVRPRERCGVVRALVGRSLMGLYEKSGLKMDEDAWTCVRSIIPAVVDARVASPRAPSPPLQKKMFGSKELDDLMRGYVPPTAAELAKGRMRTATEVEMKFLELLQGVGELRGLMSVAFDPTLSVENKLEALETVFNVWKQWRGKVGWCLPAHTEGSEGGSASENQEKERKELHLLVGFRFGMLRIGKREGVVVPWGSTVEDFVEHVNKWWGK